MTDEYGLAWVSIPSDSYGMGCSPSDSNCEPEEIPRHTVKIGAFKINETEITQAQYQTVIGENPSAFSSCGGDCPVDFIDWDHARAFCNRVGGRLPSEAEWEYAARAGKSTIFYCGNDSSCLDEVSWDNFNSGGTPHPVKSKKSNSFGLYDMSGNLWEWMEDCWHGGFYDAPTEGGVWGGGDCSYRVIRGGCWNSAYGWGLRGSSRGGDAPSNGCHSYGFRCARD